MMEKNIFVSYSSCDADAAHEIVEYLESKGKQCWIAPRDIPPGADWAEAIMEAVINSKTMILVFSSKVNTSVQVRREVEHAVASQTELIPIKLDSSEPTLALQYYISSHQWIELSDEGVKGCFHVLYNHFFPKPDSRASGIDENESLSVNMLESDTSHLNKTTVQDARSKSGKKVIPVSKYNRRLVGWLVSYTWEPMGEDYRLFDGKTLVGRDSAMDVSLPDETVSRIHSVFNYRNGVMKILDIFPANNTEVNDEVIDDGALFIGDGDIITIGQTELMLKLIEIR